MPPRKKEKVDQGQEDIQKVNEATRKLKGEEEPPPKRASKEEAGNHFLFGSGRTPEPAARNLQPKRKLELFERMGFESTQEFRPPKEGEWYVGLAGVPKQSQIDFGRAAFQIVRKKEMQHVEGSDRDQARDEEGKESRGPTPPKAVTDRSTGVTTEGEAPKQEESNDPFTAEPEAEADLRLLPTGPQDHTREREELDGNVLLLFSRAGEGKVLFAKEIAHLLDDQTYRHARTTRALHRLLDRKMIEGVLPEKSGDPVAYKLKEGVKFFN